MQWFFKAMKQYADFSGRARRAEYWWFMLIFLLSFCVLALIDGATGSWSDKAGMGLFSGIWSLVCVLPSLAVAARRLHDMGRSGWWQLLNVVPLIGFIVLIVWFARDGDSGPNRFGPDPKAAA